MVLPCLLVYLRRYKACGLLSLQEARELVERYIQHYNENRLHSAIGYVTPMDKLEGRENKISQQRDKKLEESREKRSSKNTIKIAA